jgi:hypothetical protein
MAELRDGRFVLSPRLCPLSVVLCIPAGLLCYFHTGLLRNKRAEAACRSKKSTVTKRNETLVQLLGKVIVLPAPPPQQSLCQSLCPGACDLCNGGMFSPLLSVPPSEQVPSSLS